MVELMGQSPYDFVMESNIEQIEQLKSFVHRTFNGDDFVGFINGLKHNKVINLKHQQQPPYTKKENA